MSDNLQQSIDNFFTQYSQVTYKKGEIIVFAQEAHKHVLYLKDGIVGQYDVGDSGAKVYVNLYKPTAFFPMSWAINATPNEYFFEAITDVTAYQANPAESVKFVQSNPEVMFNLLSRVYRGTDALLKRIAINGGGTAASRLAFELLTSYYRFGVAVEGDQRALSLTQSDLADRTGLARETVSRELSQLKRIGVIDASKHGLVIVNIKTLERRLSGD